MDLIFGLLVVSVLIGLNGVCVAGEFSLVAADPVRVEARAQQGSRAARLTSSLLGRLSFHLAGAQLGITVTSLLLGLMAEDTIGGLFTILPGVEATSGPMIAVGAILVATVLQMLLGELIPKNLAISKPMGVSFALAPLLRVYGLVAAPLIAAFNGMANTMVRWLGVEPTEELRAVRSLDEIDYVVRSSSDHGVIGEEDVQLLRRAIRLGSKDAADALVARTAMASIATTATVSQLVDLANSTGHSRFPVSGVDVDDIVGVVDVRDVYTLSPGQRSDTPVAALVRQVVVIPETRALDQALQDLVGARSRMGLVVDEHGGTAGILTQEDILEELVGDISDEYDAPAPMAVARRGDTFVFDGAIHAHELDEAIGLNLPDGPYETLAGFLLQRFGRIPAVGDELSWDGWRFVVSGRDRLRVAEVAVTRIDGGSLP
jgi:CBS domain containing-hemolysin-like protein